MDAKRYLQLKMGLREEEDSRILHERFLTIYKMTGCNGDPDIVDSLNYQAKLIADELIYRREETELERYWGVDEDGKEWIPDLEKQKGVR